MLLRTHLVFSVLIWILAFDYLVHPWMFLLFLIFATVIIDIDSRKSRAGRKWYFRPLQWFVSHRGMFHTVVFGLVVSVVLFLANQSAGLGFFAGYLSHLLLDLFTPQGIMLFYPFSKKRSGFGVKSGGLIEEVLFVLLLLGDLWLVGKLFIL